MERRIETKIAVPPDKLKVNFRAFETRENDGKYNQNGAVIKFTRFAVQYGDIQLWVKAAGLTAAQFAELSGKPKKTILRWLKGNPKTFARGLSPEIESQISSLMHKKSGLIVEVPEYGNPGKVVYL